MVIYLSHFLGINTPLYGGASDIEVDAVRRINRGDSSNNSKLHFPNHAGTHIDFPSHFIENGKTSSDYPPENWVFENVYLLDKAFEADEWIDFEEKELLSIPSNTELLIIKTHFGKYRNQKLYWNNNPGLHPKLANKLKKCFPKLRAIGLDVISITGFQNREIGREAHKEFLSEPAILLIEDMDLSQLHSSPLKVIGLPLQFEMLDGAPINLIAILK